MRLRAARSLTVLAMSLLCAANTLAQSATVSAREGARVITQLIENIRTDHLQVFTDDALQAGCRSAAGFSREGDAKLTLLDLLTRLSATDVAQAVELCARGIAQLLPASPPAFIGYTERQRLFNARPAAGVGLELRDSATSALVLAAHENSPAALAGIARGDRILEINGRSTAGLNAQELLFALRGDAGSRVALLMKKRQDSQLQTIVVSRAIVTVPQVRSARLVEDVGYIVFRAVNSLTLEQLLKALDQQRLHADGKPRALVLDLRVNLGGDLQVVNAIAGLFLEPGLLIGQVDARNPKFKRALSSDGATNSGIVAPSKELKEFLVTVPLYILVSPTTVAGAELIARALQSRARATVVGEVTAGSGVVHLVYPILDRAVVQIAVSTLLDDKGAPIQGQGVRPDFNVEYENDNLGERRWVVTIANAPTGFESDAAIVAVMTHLRR